MDKGGERNGSRAWQPHLKEALLSPAPVLCLDPDGTPSFYVCKKVWMKVEKHAR